ncbi:MAG: CPBP family intramembrane glutamic endopeptidase [Candidatus Omnitrophota bacterium]
MKISVKEWCLFIALALLSFWMWLNLGYPQFSFIHSSLNRAQALSKANEYLRSQGVDTERYSRAIAFTMDVWQDRYLQKTLGFRQEEDFLSRHRYELFHWKVRFFREFEKEEFILTISPRTKEVLSFRHLIEDIAPRETVDKGTAKARAEEFLRDFYKVNWSDYDFHEEKIKRLENRVDYSFSWERKDVYVPWRKHQGGAKLLIGAIVSGDEVREFYKNNLDVPEKFRRDIENQLAFGEYIYGLYFLMYIFLLGCSVYLVLKKRQDLLSRTAKRFFLTLALFLLIVNLSSILNNIQNVIIHYRTGISFTSFMGIATLKEIFDMVFLSFAFVLPGIAGESLRLNVFPNKPACAFIPCHRKTFFSRNVSRCILFGYVLFFILAGAQSGLFFIGQKTMGVWKEWIRINQLSSAYIPFLSAFAMGLTASVNEEVTFRLFGISLGKKYLKNTALAIFLTSCLWGIGHSTYAVFPVWFRAIEVGILGIIYGIIFVRYGLLPLIVAHYLFDVFWGVAGNLLGGTSRFLFVGAAFVLSIPLLLAVVCYLMNQKEDTKESQKYMRNKLTPIQQHNLGVLMTYISAKESQGQSPQIIREELIAHEWDTELVDLAMAELFESKI